MLILFVNINTDCMGNRHAAMAMRWSAYFKTAESIRSGVPQAKLDFFNSPQEELETFLRNINAGTVPAARTPRLARI